MFSKVHLPQRWKERIQMFPYFLIILLVILFVTLNIPCSFSRSHYESIEHLCFLSRIQNNYNSLLKRLKMGLNIVFH